MADGIKHRRIVRAWRSVFPTRSRGIIDDDRHGMAWAIGEAGSPPIEPLSHLRVEREDDPPREEIGVSAEFTSLAKILDLANVIITDVEGKVLHWTTGCERLYGWTSREAVGQVVHELLKSKYPTPRSEILAALREHGSWEGEIEHQTKSGSAVSVASLWVARKSEDGDIRFVLQNNTRHYRTEAGPGGAGCARGASAFDPRHGARGDDRDRRTGPGHLVQRRGRKIVRVRR